ESFLQQLLGRLFSFYSEDPSRATCVFPGLVEVIGELADQRIRWGVVTNKPAALAGPIVAALDIAPAPACLIGGDSFPRKKPDPMPLVEACRQVGVEPNEAIYVGDADIDARAAHAAGLSFVVAGFGYAPPRSATGAWGKLQYAADTGALARIVGLRTESTAGTT
ncbi:MAG: HAD-IA family hydrolase, partial [Gammaproteobacteria bacterium]